MNAADAKLVAEFIPNMNALQDTQKWVVLGDIQKPQNENLPEALNKINQLQTLNSTIFKSDLKEENKIQGQIAKQPMSVTEQIGPQMTQEKNIVENKTVVVGVAAKKDWLVAEITFEKPNELKTKPDNQPQRLTNAEVKSEHSDDLLSTPQDLENVQKDKGSVVSYSWCCVLVLVSVCCLFLYFRVLRKRSELKRTVRSFSSST